MVVTRCDLTPVAPSGVLAGQALLALLRGPAVRPCPPSCSAGVQLRASVSGSAADGLVGVGSRQVARGRGSSSWHVAECQRRVAADIWHAQQLALRVAAGAVSSDRANGDDDPCQVWHISASRHANSRWLVAEKQRKLAARVWQAQRLRVLQGARASVLQRWWLRCLAVRAGALQRLVQSASPSTPPSPRLLRLACRSVPMCLMTTFWQLRSCRLGRRRKRCSPLCNPLLRE